MPNDGGATWTSYGKAFGSSNSWRTKLWSSIALCQSRSKYARKEQWRRGKQRTAATVFFRTFGALPEVHFLHAIYHFKAQEVRIQRFKLCMIWSWNKEDMAFGRQLHHAKWPISQGEFHIAKISQGDFLHGAKFCHFAPWRNTLRKFCKEDLGTLRNSFESPVLRRCWCYSTTGSPRYFAWFLAL